MTLTELLNMQRELQTHSNAQPQTLEQIRLAQLAELGEIVQAVKWGVEDEHPAWAWWHRDSKVSAQRDALAGELADLLCFVLLEIITFQNDGVFYEIGSVWEDAWAAASVKDDYLIKLVGYTRNILNHRGNSQVFDFVNLCKTFGFTQDDIETAYKAAYDKNVARWQNA